jgi:SAM-dependent methyltransferase
VSGFSAEWLALREPFDAAARAAGLVTGLAPHLAPATRDAPLEIVDLGAGAGSNLRYLAPRLGGPQRWRLVDHDPDLLAAAFAETREWAITRGALVAESTDALTVREREHEWQIRCERRDLAQPSAAPLTLPHRGLVTAAALLDLVGEAWLMALLARCRAAHAAVCFALTYDGRSECTPAEPEDAEVLALFNRHQRLDKGFGAALGPDAARVAEAALRAHGYNVAAAASDWLVEPAHTAMQEALLDGWLGAALEIAPERRGALADWHRRRVAHVALARSALRVGHVDLVGWL